MTLTAEQVIVHRIDQAWTDRLLIEARIEADWFYSPEDRNNAWCYLETAQRTIDAGHRELDTLRAQLAVTEERVAFLVAAVSTVGDPMATAVAYLVYGPEVLVADEPVQSVDEIPAGQLQAHDVLCDDSGNPFAVVATVIGDDESGVWASTYDVATGKPWIPMEFPAGTTAVILARAS